MRCNAKSFDDLPPEASAAYHRCHISKTMGIAFVAFAFKDTIENGGIAMKLGLHRAQSAKIAQRLTRNKKGEILREKGQPYLVDCCVTGSDSGTAKNPKYPLLKLFQSCIFPQIENLTKEGSQFFGYKVVIQGDNAGPHSDRTFYKYVNEYCMARGWLWEPQAPQMPHLNVLDLAVFPSMSKRHSHEARSVHGKRVLSENEIWKNAMDVWEKLPSSKIANSFVVAKRNADKVIKYKGSNHFLSGYKGAVDAGVRQDFEDTADGNRRKDKNTLPFIPKKETTVKREKGLTENEISSV